MLLTQYSTAYKCQPSHVISSNSRTLNTSRGTIVRHSSKVCTATGSAPICVPAAVGGIPFVRLAKIQPPSPAGDPSNSEVWQGIEHPLCVISRPDATAVRRPKTPCGGSRQCGKPAFYLCFGLFLGPNCRCALKWIVNSTMSTRGLSSSRRLGTTTRA